MPFCFSPRAPPQGKAAGRARLLGSAAFLARGGKAPPNSEKASLSLRREPRLSEGGGASAHSKTLGSSVFLGKGARRTFCGKSIQKGRFLHFSEKNALFPGKNNPPGVRGQRREKDMESRLPWDNFLGEPNGFSRVAASMERQLKILHAISRRSIADSLKHRALLT